MDLDTASAYIECTPARVKCPVHGVVTASVPWAEPGSRFTREFEDQVAWLAVHCSMKAVSELMRIDWHTVGGICRRVYLLALILRVGGGTAFPYRSR
ncbi:MAG: transposase family protein [Atopobiaceae bacterium]|nr:transposase family protein [Atopobiaceae bacterium]